MKSMHLPIWEGSKSLSGSHMSLPTPWNWLFYYRQVERGSKAATEGPLYSSLESELPGKEDSKVLHDAQPALDPEPTGELWQWWQGWALSFSASQGHCVLGSQLQQSCTVLPSLSIQMLCRHMWTHTELQGHTWKTATTGRVGGLKQGWFVTVETGRF